jgi:hypothetical protein
LGDYRCVESVDKVCIVPKQASTLSYSTPSSGQREEKAHVFHNGISRQAVGGSQPSRVDRHHINAGNAAAAGPTPGVVPAAADEVSALTAAQFAAHGERYQALSTQAAAIHHLLVATLAAAAGSYAATEAANAASAV